MSVSEGPERSMIRKAGRPIIILCFCFLLCWGSIPLFARLAQGIDPLLALALRYLTALILLLAFVPLWYLIKKSSLIAYSIKDYIRGNYYYYHTPKDTSKGVKIYKVPRIVIWFFLGLILLFLPIYFYFLGLWGGLPKSIAVAVSYTYPIITVACKVVVEKAPPKLLIFASIITVMAVVVSVVELEVAVRPEIVFPLSFSLLWSFSTLLIEKLSEMTTKLYRSLSDLDLAKGKSIAEGEMKNLFVQHGFMKDSELTVKARTFLKDFEFEDAIALGKILRILFILIFAALFSVIILVLKEGEIGLGLISHYYISILVGANMWPMESMIGILGLAAVSTALAYPLYFTQITKLAALKCNAGLANILQSLEPIGGIMLVTLIPPHEVITPLQIAGIVAILVMNIYIVIMEYMGGEPLRELIKILFKSEKFV